MTRRGLAVEGNRAVVSLYTDIFYGPISKNDGVVYKFCIISDGSVNEKTALCLFLLIIGTY